MLLWLNFFQQCDLISLHKYSKRQIVKSLGQSESFIQRQEFFLILLLVYISCAISLQNRFFSQYKNHVKSSGITKRLLKMWFDICLKENKSFTYCFEVFMLQMYLEGCEYANIARVLGSRSSPAQKVQSMALHKSILQTFLSTAKGKKKKIETPFQK